MIVLDIIESVHTTCLVAYLANCNRVNSGFVFNTVSSIVKDAVWQGSITSIYIVSNSPVSISLSVQARTSTAYDPEFLVPVVPPPTQTSFVPTVTDNGVSSSLKTIKLGSRGA